MRDLDETDLNILRLLIEDGRRPYSEIADKVAVSPPTVSDRIERLKELGVIRRFTLDVDRSMLDEGVTVLIDLTLKPGANGEVKKRLATLEAVEHVLVTADSHVVVKAVLEDADIEPLLNGALDMDDVAEYDVRLVTDSLWSPHISDASLAVTCDECGNRVTSEGVSARIDDELYHFCCESCRENFEEQYRQLADSAD
jgi:DNA-binding Lrp family transcriptional regulator